jgi:hypothetical protein
VPGDGSVDELLANVELVSNPFVLKEAVAAVPVGPVSVVPIPAEPDQHEYVGRTQAPHEDEHERVALEDVVKVTQHVR